VSREDVLIVCLARGLGGSTRSIVTLLDTMDDSFRRVLCVPEGGPFLRMVKERELIDEHVDIPNRGTRWKGKLSRFRAMLRIALWTARNRRTLAAIHANGPEELNLVVPAALIFRVRVVVWSHARDVSPWMRRLAPFLRPALRHIDVHWAAVSNFAREVLVEAGIAKADEVEIVPNPIDPRDVLGTGTHNGDRLVVGYLGSDAPYKGFQLLPDLVDALSQRKIHWMIFSAKRSSRNAEAWDRLQNADPALVTIAGKLEDVREAYSQCDVVCLPSLDESFGRVAAEAMLNGLPVVASDLAPVREVLGGGRAGLLFPPGDVGAAAAAILSLESDEALRRSIGLQGRDLATAFEPHSVVAQLTSLYQGRPARPELEERACT